MRKLLLSFFALVIPFMVFAGNRITEQQAMRIAGEFLNSGKVRMASKIPASSRNLKMVKKTAGEEYFICSDGMNHSFVIVSGDDAVGPVLGYSTEGAFVTENMPENVKFFLGMLENAVKYYRTHPNAADDTPNTADDTEKVLETALWNQGAPYNNMTPMDGSKHSVTGCVATAMAIVMRYHNWPDCGVGTIPAYITPNGINVPAIELGYAYDWSNMLMEYKSNKYTEVQGNAVARLMADCGASVEMQYSASSSGAYSDDIVPALSTYFKYDKSARYVRRVACTKAQWVEYIHNDIDNNRPLIFGAQSTQDNGGHEFVGDGYRGNDYVHINFGWGGSDNGFYHVTSMDEWGASVDAVFNVKPDEGGIQELEPRLGLKSDLTLSAPYVLGHDLSVRGAWFNYGNASFTGKTGAGIRGVDDKLKYIVSKSHTNLEPNYGYTSTYTFTDRIVKAGEQVQLYYQSQGQSGWKKMNYYEDDVKGIVYPAGQKEDFMQYVKFSYDKSTKTMSFILPYNDVVDQATGATEFSWKLKDKNGKVVTSAVSYDNLVISIASGSLPAGRYTFELSYWDVCKSITLPIDNSLE